MPIQAPLPQVKPLSDLGVVPKITQKGINLVYDGTAKHTYIPYAAGGVYPSRIRLATTTAAFVNLGNMSAAIAAAGTGYKPGVLITLAGGTPITNQAGILQVATTKLITYAIKAGAAGSGGAPDGAGVILEGTTGTGTKYRVSGTVNAGALASIQSITVAGAYTTNPTITNDPLIYISGTNGVGLVGAALDTIVMGVESATVYKPGQYVTANQPADAVAQSGNTVPASGTGATFNVTWNTAAAVGDILVQPGDALIVDSYGYDHVGAIQVSATGTIVVTPIDN